MSNNISKIMEAYKSMKVSEQSGNPTGIKIYHKDKKTGNEHSTIVFTANDAHRHEKQLKRGGHKVVARALMHGTKEGERMHVKESYEFDESVDLGESLQSYMEACSRMKSNKEQAEVEEKMSSKEKMAKGLYNKKEAMDPVGQEDDDVDNDGDTDKSDEYLKKRRKAIAKNEAVEDGDSEEEPVVAPKKSKGAPKSSSTKDFKDSDHQSDKKAEISKIESVDTREAFIALWSQIEEAASHTKDALAPEEIDSKESPKSKEFIAKHKQSDKKIEDGEEKGHDMATKAGQVTKQAPNRGNDNLSNGDKKPVKGN